MQCTCIEGMTTCIDAFFVWVVSVEMTLLVLKEQRRQVGVPIAVIAVAPTGKSSLVYSYVQTRLKGQYNGK